MVETCVLTLSEYLGEGDWVIGTPKAVEKPERYSTQIQIKYHNSKLTGPLRKKETYHKHIGSIEEYYLVLDGTLTLCVEGEYYEVQNRELLAVPPNKCHKVVSLSDDVEYITFRAPYSGDMTKQECEEKRDPLD